MTSPLRRAPRATVALIALVAAGSLAAPAHAQQEPLKVAGIHASPVENAWNSRLHEAMLEADEAGAIEYTFSEGVSGTDYARAMREYAEQGVDLVVGESYAVEREARQVAADYPDVDFVMGSSGEPSGDNFGTFGTWNHEGAYLAGMLAGAMTESDVVGSVGAIPIPEVNMLINAFEAGVMETNPDAKHLVSFIGTFFDPPKAREAGLAQIDAGADILFGERIGTADAAKERGVPSVGSLIDYTERYPDTVFRERDVVLPADPRRGRGRRRRRRARRQELHRLRPHERGRQRHRVHRERAAERCGRGDARATRRDRERRVRGRARHGRPPPDGAVRRSALPARGRDGARRRDRLGEGLRDRRAGGLAGGDRGASRARRRLPGWSQVPRGTGPPRSMRPSPTSAVATAGRPHRPAVRPVRSRACRRSPRTSAGRSRG